MDAFLRKSEGIDVRRGQKEKRQVREWEWGTINGFDGEAKRKKTVKDSAQQINPSNLSNSSNCVNDVNGCQNMPKVCQNTDEKQDIPLHKACVSHCVLCVVCCQSARYLQLKTWKLVWSLALRASESLPGIVFMSFGC